MRGKHCQRYPAALAVKADGQNDHYPDIVIDCGLPGGCELAVRDDRLELDGLGVGLPVEEIDEGAGLPGPSKLD